MDLSIAIVSWNTRDLLDGCLESIFETTRGIEFEVIVVDNASSDGSAEMVRDKYPQVRLIENADNVGFAAANNQAYAVTESEFFLLLNPDTILRPLSVAQLVAAMEADQRCGIVAPKLLWPSGSIQPSVSRFPTLANELVDALFLSKLVRRGQAGFYVPTDEVGSLIECARGACLLVRRQAVPFCDKILDERYFMFSEEVDLCKSVRDNGWSVLYEPRAEVVHIGSGSTSLAPKEMLAEMYWSKVLYFRKHYSWLYSGVYRYAVVPIHCWLRVLAYPLALIGKTSSVERERVSPTRQMYLLRSMLFGPNIRRLTEAIGSFGDEGLPRS